MGRAGCGFAPDRDTGRDQARPVELEDRIEDSADVGGDGPGRFAIEAQGLFGDFGDAGEFMFGFGEQGAGPLERGFAMHQVKEVGDGFEGIVDLVGDAGGEAAGDGQLLGSEQGFLGERVLVDLVADLILPLAAAQGDLEGAQQGFGADGTFEQEGVAERPAKFAEALALDGDAAADGEQDDGKVGPLRLMLQDVQQ